MCTSNWFCVAMLWYIELIFHTQTSYRIRNKDLRKKQSYTVKIASFSGYVKGSIYCSHHLHNSASLCHGSNQILYSDLWYHLSFMLQRLTELVQWKKLELALSDASIKFVQKMFYGVQIQRLWGPWQYINVVLN